MIDHTHMMDVAARLAVRGLGSVWPAPAQGCVVTVSSGQERLPMIAGRGYTDKIARALPRALGSAGPGAWATFDVYLTHMTDEDVTDVLPLAPANIRVGSDMGDPTGLEARRSKLEQAGINVEIGVNEASVTNLNEGFFCLQKTGYPFLTLKLETSLDGRIATGSGRARELTGQESRAYGSRLRYETDAVMVGGRMAASDNPELMCRLSAYDGDQPVRIVTDGHLRLPLTAKMVQSANEVPTWIITCVKGDDERATAFRDCGVDVISVAADSDRKIDLRAALTAIGGRGITRILVEGGARLAASLMAGKMVNRIIWMQAPEIIGGDGRPAIADLGFERLDELISLRRRSIRQLGQDLVHILDVEQ